MLFPGWPHCGRSWLLSRILVELLSGGTSPLVILEGKGKSWSFPTPPRLLLVMFHRPIPLEIIISTGLDLFDPGLAITRSLGSCLYGSRCILRAGLLSFPSSCAWCIGASCRGLQFLLGGLAGLTGHKLGLPGWCCPCQVRTLPKVALFRHHSMVITAGFYPASEISQAIESEACGSIEKVLYIGHVLNLMTLLDVQQLLLA